MRWLGRYSLALVLLGGSACGDDQAVATGTDGSTTGTGTGTGTSGVDETSVPDETSTPDDTSDDDPTTGDPMPCERNSDCDDGNECTDDVCNAGVCEVGEAVVSAECRPQIEVDYPPRAATLEGNDATVTVTGTVQSGAAPIASLTINGQDVPVQPDDGSFSYDYDAHVGGNTLVFDAMDELNVPRKRVQSFLWSPSYRFPMPLEQGMADEGLAIYLDQQTLDDGNHSPPTDDLATLLGIALDSIDIQQFINPAAPIASNAGYNVYLTTIAYDSTDVTLEAIDGGLHLEGFLYGISGDLVFDCTIVACQLAGGDGTGDMDVDYIRVASDLMVSVNGSNQLVVNSANTQTSVVGLDITSNNPWTNFLITIIEPFILGGVVADIESELTGQVDSLLGPSLSEAFNGLAPNSMLAFPSIADPANPIEVQLVTDFFSTDFHDGIAPPASSPPQGGVITLRGGAFAQDILTPYRNLGIPDRNGCGDGGGLQMPRDGELEIGLSDDLLNQLLFGAWRGGLLEFDMPPELLGGTGLIEDLEIHVSGMLAPTASDCGGPPEVLVHLGDVRIDASLVLGANPINFVAFSSLEASLEFTPTGSGVEITIADVQTIDTELTVEEDYAIDTEPLLVTTLEDALVDGVIDAIANGGLGAIELPQIDLSATLGLPPGTAQLIISTDDTVRAPGVTVIRGHL